MFFVFVLLEFICSLDCSQIITGCNNCNIDESTSAYYCLDDFCKNDVCSYCKCQSGYYEISNNEKLLCKPCSTLTGVENCRDCYEAAPNKFQCLECMERYYYKNGKCIYYQDIPEYEIDCTRQVEKAVKGVCSSSSCLGEYDVKCECKEGAICTANDGYYYIGNNVYRKCSYKTANCSRCKYDSKFICESCSYGYALHSNGTCLSCTDIFGSKCHDCIYIEDDMQMYKCLNYDDEYGSIHWCPPYYIPFYGDRICVHISYYFSKPHNDILHYYYEYDHERLTNNVQTTICNETYGWTNWFNINCHCNYPKKVHNGKCYTVVDCPNDPKFARCQKCGYIENWDLNITCIVECAENQYFDEETLQCLYCGNKFGSHCHSCTSKECTEGCGYLIYDKEKQYYCNDIFGSACNFCKFDGKEAVCTMYPSTIEGCKDGWIYEGKPNHCTSCSSTINCSLCSSLNECETCIKGFYMLDDGSKKCVSCKDTYGKTCSTCDKTECLEIDENIIQDNNGNYYTCQEVFGENCKKCKFENNEASCTECVKNPTSFIEIYCNDGWKTSYNDIPIRCTSCSVHSKGCKKCTDNYCYECFDGYIAQTVSSVRESFTCHECSEFFNCPCSKCDENHFCTYSNFDECSCPTGYGINIINETTLQCQKCTSLGQGCNECSFEEDKAICYSECTNEECYCPLGYIQTSASPFTCELPFVCKVENCQECQNKEPHKCLTCKYGYSVTESFECSKDDDSSSPNEIPNLPDDLFDYVDNTLTIYDPSYSVSNQHYKITLPDSLENIILNNIQFSLLLNFTKVKTENPISIDSKLSANTSYLEFNEDQNANLFFIGKKYKNINIQGAASLKLNGSNPDTILELGSLIIRNENNNYMITSEVPAVFDNIVLNGKTKLVSNSSSKIVAAKNVSLQQGVSSSIKNIQILNNIDIPSNTNLNLEGGIIFSESLSINVYYDEKQRLNFALNGLLPSNTPQKIRIKSDKKNAKKLDSNYILPIASNDEGKFNCSEWQKNCFFDDLNKFNKCKCSNSLLEENDNNDNYLYAIFENSPSSPKSSKGMSKGLLIGIIVAAVVVVALIVFLLVFFLVIKKRKAKVNQSSSEEGI